VHLAVDGLEEVGDGIRLVDPFHLGHEALQAFDRLQRLRLERAAFAMRLHDEVEDQGAGEALVDVGRALADLGAGAEEAEDVVVHLQAGQAVANSRNTAAAASSVRRRFCTDTRPIRTSHSVRRRENSLGPCSDPCRLGAGA
jgi:hypothetical protein